MLNQIKNEIARNSIRNIKSISLDENNSEKFCLLEVEDKYNTEKNIMTRICFMEGCDAFSEKQNEILKMRLDGYSQFEIAKKINVSNATISRELSKIKEKLKYYLE